MKNKHAEQIINYVNNREDSEAYFADGFDECVIGYSHEDDRVIYSTQLMVDTVTEETGMPVPEALEYLEFNTFGAYVGPHTPIWCYDEF